MTILTEDDLVLILGTLTHYEAGDDAYFGHMKI
jgi:hypothetical protein